MALFVANNGQLQTIKGIYYGMSEDYINATLFHNLVPKTATEIKFLYASNNPDLTGYQRVGYCDDNNFIEVYNSGTKYIIINPRKNYIFAPTYCGYFFNGYTALSDCILDNFNTENVTNMFWMFNDCSSLTSLDVSSFNTQNVTNMHRMFSRCTLLTTIISYTFNTYSISDSGYMFLDSPNLVGCNGTTYSSSHTNAEYARVDGENDLPGYFTAPTN